MLFGALWRVVVLFLSAGLAVACLAVVGCFIWARIWRVKGRLFCRGYLFGFGVFVALWGFCGACVAFCGLPSMFGAVVMLSGSLCGSLRRVLLGAGRSLRLWVFVHGCSDTGRGASCGGSWGYGSGGGFCILSAFRRGSSRRGLLLFQLGDGFGDPRRRSLSVGASAPAPGSVARSSACVRLAAAPCVSNCDGVKWKINTCIEAFRLADF